MNYEEQIESLRGASKEELKRIIFMHDRMIDDLIKSINPEDVTKKDLIRIHRTDVYIQNLLINALSDRTD